MTGVNRKSEIITFKVDESLREALKGIRNRSNFIRSAVIAALEGGCPLCHGTGVLTPSQREHWNTFIRDHSIEECEKCHEPYIVCSHQPKRKTKQRRKK